MTPPSSQGRGNALWDGCRSAHKELRFSSRWKSAAPAPTGLKRRPRAPQLWVPPPRGPRGASRDPLREALGCRVPAGL